jgi:hypothetical protein
MRRMSQWDVQTLSTAAVVMDTEFLYVNTTVLRDPMKRTPGL